MPSTIPVEINNGLNKNQHENMSIFNVLNLRKNDRSSTVDPTSFFVQNAENVDLNPIALDVDGVSESEECTEAIFTHIQSLQGETDESVNSLLVGQLDDNIKDVSGQKHTQLERGVDVSKGSILKCLVCRKEYVRRTPYEKHLKIHTELQRGDSENSTAQSTDCGLSSEQGDDCEDDDAVEQDSSGEEYSISCDNDEDDDDDDKKCKKKTFTETKATNKKTIKRVNVVHECEHCKEQFTNKQKYERHIRTHVPRVKKTHICPYCNRDMKRSFNLKKHIRTHTKERPFKCDQCEKLFATSDTLTIHKRRHTGDKRYKCIHCSKGFVKKSVLTDHLRVHSGEKPHVCQHCQKAFTQRPTLVEHLRTHTKEKPFQCETCGKSFRFRNVLKCHSMTHTGVRPFNCNVCGKGFIKNVMLVSHMKKHHSENL